MRAVYSARVTSLPIRIVGTASLAMLNRGLSLLILVSLCACGARRSVLIESDPAGALVRLDDEVIGTTPIDHPFVHYGTRRVTVYLPGYRTWSELIPLEPHWYGRFPLDLVTEVLLPLNLRDQRKVEVQLVADDGSDGDGDADAFLERAGNLYIEDLTSHAAQEAGAAQAQVKPQGASK